MKRLLQFIPVIGCFFSLAAQTITTNPAFFDETEEIDIVVSNFDPQTAWGVTDLYLWAWHFDENGSQINNPTATGTDFGNSPETAKFTNNMDGTYTYTLTPTTFYDNTNISRIAFLVKSKDGSNQTGDIFKDVGRVKINITNPNSSLVLVDSGANLAVSASISFQGGSTVQGSFEIFYNDVSVATGNCGFPACNATISNITESGTVRFVGTPPGETETGEASFQVLVKPTVIEQALPSGLQDGINYGSDQTTATLVLSAPQKDFIQIAGSFNDYSPTNVDVMNRDPSTGKYWLQITNLTPGKIETYQYWAYDATPIANSKVLVKVADPFSTLVLSPFDDQFIPSNTYPDMPAYPEGQNFEVTVLQTGQTPYNWQVDDFDAPKEEDLVVYEVLVRDFDADRNYQDLIDKIDYFKNLNINAIQLMPVMEFEGNESWGYNTAFHLALDKFYGTEDKFKEFIDVCHQNGIAVILDVALNHAFGRNPMVRLWVNDPEGDGFGNPSSENPYFNQTALHSYSVGSDLNHQSELTQEYTRRVVKHWVEDFKVDGFRWDLTKGFTQNCTGSDEGCTNGYQQDRVDILKEYADYSWSLDPDHYVIFEHLGAQNEEKEWANYKLDEGKGIMMWGKMTDPYSQLLMGFNSDNNINGIGHKSRSQFAGPRLIGYPESHDEERLMYRAVTFGNESNGSHNVRDLNTALSRMSAIGAMTLTVPGPKMLWHFGELGMDNSIFTCPDGSVNNPNCKLDTKPQPQWSENWLADTNRNKIYNDWARLNALKINEPVFEGDYTITSGNLTPRIDIFDTSLPASELKNVVVLANFDVQTRNVDTNFPITGTWYDLMDNTGNTTYSAANVTLAPGEFRIFGNRPSTLSTEQFKVANDFDIFPNPANNSFKINKSISSLQIFDITGKSVKSFKGDFKISDAFDISDLTQGLYLVKIENLAGASSTAKLIKQ